MPTVTAAATLTLTRTPRGDGTPRYSESPRVKSEGNSTRVRVR